MAPRSSTASTASRRPSPLRESTYPPASSPAGPSSSSGSNDRPSDLYHPHPASQSQPRTPRPKSIINLLLRASALDNATPTAPTPRHAPKHGKPTRASTTDDIERDRASSAIKSLGRWDKRASRKAPLPPAAKTAEESGAASAMAPTAGPELSRQPGKQISSHGLEEENGDLWDREEDIEDIVGGQKGWEGIDSLPKVFLFPPEEGERSASSSSRSSHYLHTPRGRIPQLSYCLLWVCESDNRSRQTRSSPSSSTRRLLRP